MHHASPRCKKLTSCWCIFLGRGVPFAYTKEKSNIHSIHFRSIPFALQYLRHSRVERSFGRGECRMEPMPCITISTLLFTDWLSPSSVERDLTTYCSLPAFVWASVCSICLARSRQYILFLVDKFLPTFVEVQNFGLAIFVRFGLWGCQCAKHE
jgi:hypothetical protein